MQKALLYVTLLFLTLSCAQNDNHTRTPPIQSRNLHKTSLSLPEEDAQLLSTHYPVILKKIRELSSINLDEIILLQQLGFTSDIMILIINHTNSHFHLSTTDVLRLQAEGVSFKVINYMIRT